MTESLSNRQLVPDLHDPHTGRLDARRISEFFGVPLAEIARVLGVSLSRLHKTPGARSAQQGLYLLERVAYCLLALVGTKEASRAWLNLPESQLAGKTPLEAIREGRGSVVAEMLDDMLVGQPS